MCKFAIATTRSIVVVALLAPCLNAPDVYGQNYPTIDSDSGSDMNHTFNGQWDTDGDDVADLNHQLKFTTQSSLVDHIKSLRYESIQSQIQGLGWLDPPFENPTLNTIGGHSGIRGLAVTSVSGTRAAASNTATFDVDWTFDGPVPAGSKIVLWDPGEGSNLSGNSSYRFDVSLAGESLDALNWGLAIEDPYPNFDAAGTYAPTWLPGAATVEGGHELYLQQFPVQVVVLTVDHPFDRLQLYVDSSSNERFGLALSADAAVVPIQPLRGDCNNDGLVTPADLDCACQIDSGGVDLIQTILNATGLNRGDIDGNGEVAFADFLVLSSHFGEKVDSYTDGDLDCNGEVAFTDCLLLSANFGKRGETMATNVPEPTSLSMLALALPLVLMFRRAP